MDKVEKNDLIRIKEIINKKGLDAHELPKGLNLLLCTEYEADYKEFINAANKLTTRLYKHFLREGM